MEAIDFVKSISDRVIEDDLLIYQNILDGDDKMRDLTWKKFLEVYIEMSPERQKSLLEFIRLIQVNTVSHIFGIIDGSSYLNESREDFVLTAGTGRTVISGDLQDLFLELEENR